MSSWKELKENPRLKKIHDDRMIIQKVIREFFWSNGFQETETPLAIRLPGQEPYLNPVPVRLQDAGKNSYDFYFRTSPEFALKKLLAVGYEKIFEIGKCFRDGEDIRGSHSPEFTMIEWYRAPGAIKEIMDDTEKLFKKVLKKLEKNSLQYNGKEIPALLKWQRVSLKKIFKKYLEVDLDKYLEIEPLKQLAEKIGLNISEQDEYEDVFFKIFLNKIEPQLGLEKPVFVYDYPARMCSLSKLTENDPRYAERFELYVGGLEVANAFGELLDPIEQEKRLKEDQALRSKLGRKIWSIDQDFIKALANIEVKQAAGIALGLDRMVVLCTGAKDINEVIFSNISDQLTF